MIFCDNLADAAASFLGVRFRLHGRDPATGLDCIGLLAVSLERLGIATRPPTGYGLRNARIDRWVTGNLPASLSLVSDAVRRGDVLLVQPGPQQHHLMIAEGSTSVIHAHAGLRRVVCERLEAGAKIAVQWRLTI
jgi:cell wall-associated NlpC family hydrolase